ncbi:MAG: hypothetical protein Q4G03_12115, partial [Planctomycetia bacterium]|nr:hypothetical protein [Planctomycetia bacterium]
MNNNMNLYQALSQTPVVSSIFARSSRQKNAPATRGLKLETLENRELLSATTWESPAAPTETAAFVQSYHADLTSISLATLESGVERIEATVASLGGNKANIEWTRVQGATKYYLMSSTSTDGENYSAWTGMKYVNDPDDSSQTVATQLTLTTGKYYLFKVRAVTAQGVTDFTETEFPIVVTKPESPVITTAAIDHATGIADVEFQTVDNANLYRVDYTFDDGATWQFAKYVSVGEGEATSTKIYIDAESTSAVVSHKLNANKTYYFRVRATNDCGSSEYTISDPIAYMGAAAPQWVSAQEQVGAHYATITWAASESATEYFIQSSTNGGESWSGVKKASASEFTYDAANDTYSYTYFISTGKTYLFRVRAYNELGADGSSTESNPVSLSVVGIPENFRVAGAEAVNPTTYPIGERYSKVTVTLSWDAADNATKYVVKYSKDGGDWKLLKNINDPSVTSVTFGALAGSVYNFSIMAVNAISFSEEVNTGTYGVYKAGLNHVDVVAGQTLQATGVAPTETSAAYQWQYRTGAGDWIDIPGANDSSYTPTAEDVANQYWIRVLVSGALSDCNAGSYVAEGVAAPVVGALNPPSNFTFGEYNSETHALPMSWVDNSDVEDGYYIEYSIDGGVTWAKSAWLDANVTERTGTVYEENTYQFRIRAYNASGYSAWAYSAIFPNPDHGPDVPSLCVTIPGDVVDPNDGEISLREAILYAAQYPELGSEITFAPWLDGQTITVTNGELAVNQTLTFNGSGQNITVSAGYASRLFKVSASGVTFDGLTLANGSASQGGAIYLNSGSVTVKNGGICDNRATNGYGSAVYVNRGTLTIDSSRVTGNTGRNGTIYARRGTTVNVVNSLMVENSATNGGAVYAANGSTLQVYNATITNNTATSGAALYIDGATVKMYNTIIYDNNEYSWYISGQYRIETYNCLVSEDYSSRRPPVGSNHNNVTGYGVVLDSNYRPYYNSENDKS